MAQKAREAIADRELTLNEIRSIIRVLELSTSSNMRLLNELQSMEISMTKGHGLNSTNPTPPTSLEL